MQELTSELRLLSDLLHCLYPISLELIPGVAVVDEAEFQEDLTQDIATELFNASEL
jgi:hypothetical protein